MIQLHFNAKQLIEDWYNYHNFIAINVKLCRICEHGGYDSNRLYILYCIICLFMCTGTVEKTKFFIGLRRYLHQCQEKISYCN